MAKILAKTLVSGKYGLKNSLSGIIYLKYLSDISLICSKLLAIGQIWAKISVYGQILAKSIYWFSLANMWMQISWYLPNLQVQLYLPTL